eukprot:GHVH01016440.1.p1 GENE.GHVH01016440.1~~GHVH01016440.1.p1  ORF type:complete len:314 (+),score=31.60 GHVH01016440.1:23-964(+)
MDETMEEESPRRGGSEFVEASAGGRRAAIGADWKLNASLDDVGSRVPARRPQRYQERSPRRRYDERSSRSRGGREDYRPRDHRPRFARDSKPQDPPRYPPGARPPHPRHPGGPHGQDNHRRRKLNKRHIVTTAEQAVLKTELGGDGKMFTVSFKGTVVCSIDRGSGQMILNSGGWKTVSTLSVINSCLRPFNMAVNEDDTAASSGHSILGTEWSIRSYNTNIGRQPGGKALHAISGKALNSAHAGEIQNFEDNGIVSIGAEHHYSLIAGRASILEQYMTQLRLSLKARIKFGSRPPTISALPSDVFIQRAEER